MTSRPLTITTGEPAGIGPEIALKAAWSYHKPLCLIGDKDYLQDLAQKLQLGTDFPSNVQIHHTPLYTQPTLGQLDARNAPYVIETLRIGHELALSGQSAGIVTCPVQKSILDTPEHPFSGHTEYFQEKSHTQKVVMMLVSSDQANALRVALATTHLPLRKVPDAITEPLLIEVLSIIHKALIQDFGIAQPRIAVTGLNPHAGEDGHMGDEEIRVITPALRQFQTRGTTVLGPLPADTAFTPHAMQTYDAILAMYHDQGLAVLKHVGFETGVNITLGLPYIRTSVDHGTALDIAAQFTANPSSLLAALQLACTLNKNRESNLA